MAQILGLLWEHSRGDFTRNWFANYHNDHITLAPEAADPSGMLNSLLQDYKVLGEGRCATR